MEPPCLRHGAGGLKPVMPKEYSPASLECAPANLKMMVPREYSPANLKAMAPKGCSAMVGAAAWVENGMDVHAMMKMLQRRLGFQTSK